MNDIDIKKLEAEMNRLQLLVYRDELTGAFNRRGFMEDAGRMFHLVSYNTTNLERRTGFEIPFSVIFLDIDNFKKLNDTYGHQAGDKALQAVAQSLQKTLRSGDLFGRFGGEEFVVALLGANLERGRVIGEKLRMAIETMKFAFDDRDIPVTVSVGVAAYNNAGTLEDLVEKADKAMYLAKQNGKNRVELFKE